MGSNSKTSMFTFTARSLISISIPQYFFYSLRPSNCPRISTSKTIICYISYICTNMTKNSNLDYSCCHAIFSRALFFSLVLMIWLRNMSCYILRAFPKTYVLSSMDPSSCTLIGNLFLHRFLHFGPWGCIVTKVVCTNIVLDTTYSKEILKGSPNFIQVTLTPWNFEVHFDCWHFRLFLCTKQSRETLNLLSYKGKKHMNDKEKNPRKRDLGWRSSSF